LDGSWAVGGLSIVFCVMVADEAFNDRVSALRAYGLAVLAFATLVPVAEWLLAGHFGWSERGTPTIPWWAQVLLFQGGVGVSIYAYWRVTQRTMLQTQAAETERVRNEQRLQSAKLLALQSRVEPQMLFDTLGRVAQLHARDAEAADQLLSDLIALLRAMQPGASADDSTIEREFALVEAWLRVSRNPEEERPRVPLRATPEALRAGIAPMLVLPLLRAALVSARGATPEWRLDAQVVGQRLIVTLEPSTETDVPDLATSPDLSSLRERLSVLFGRTARLMASARPALLTLDLPRLQEDCDDDSADR
jgi:LytS/YehU family sensor histidine kinase